MSAKKLPVIDNTVNNSVQKMFEQWFKETKCLRIATAFFEIGSLLALDGEWQKIDSIRILMGDEIAKRTRNELIASLKHQFDESIEQWKEKDDALTGLFAIREALSNKKIEFRIYTKSKFHAKCYLFENRNESYPSTALVGSSNFTRPGITQNIELNYRVTVDSEVEFLSDWFEEHWEKAEKDFVPELIEMVERQIKLYTPFTVYSKALHEYFEGKEIPLQKWEEEESVLYSPVLSKYQREGYRQLMKIAGEYNGALLCDGVGLGKTYIGLMLIERLLHDRKRVCLLVPKSTKNSVWLPRIKKYFPEVFGTFGNNLAVFTHPQLLSETRQDDWNRIQKMADAFIIDEAHHFRNINSQRSRKLFEVIDSPASPKQIFHLTATPINNSLLDLQHLIEYFSRRNENYFKNIGINSVRGHFVTEERRIRKKLQISDDALDDAAALFEQARDDRLMKAVVVQRSRAYVKESEKIEGGTEVVFPQRQMPHVVPYSLKKIYGDILERVAEAFNKDEPLLYLRIYNPYYYFKGDTEKIDPMVKGRQKQVVSLIRTMLLKRFESSCHSFKLTCGRLLLKLSTFIKKYDSEMYERWVRQQKSLLDMLEKEITNFSFEDSDDDPWPGFDSPEEGITPDMFDIPAIVKDTKLDMDVLAELLNTMKHLTADHDDKLNSLIDKLESDDKLSKHKVLIFTEFKDTAKYLASELIKRGFDNVDEVDSGCDRESAVLCFAPFYNSSSPKELADKNYKQTRILISTDVLAEGLNLQDAFLLINYDIHWNPVRLMQRIGRVDRRMDIEIEDAILEYDPSQKEYRGKIWYWNFLPPNELNKILSLYSRVTHKTLRISETFGIEGGKLLTPEDHYRALELFNEEYEGRKSPEEEMRNIYDRILKSHPDLEAKLNNLPKRLFSGKKADTGLPKGLFACYSFPVSLLNSSEQFSPDFQTESDCKWFFIDEENNLTTDPPIIHEWIKCSDTTPRDVSNEKPPVEKLKRIEQFIKKSELKKRTQITMDQVAGNSDSKIKLICWMEIV